MTRFAFALTFTAIGIAAASPARAAIINIDGTNSVGTTVDLAAGTYGVTYAGIAGGGLYDGYSLALSGSTPVRYTDELSITLGAATNFGAAATYDYLVGGVQQNYATASQALAAYQAALASGTLSGSASYTPQDYTTRVNAITFTLASAGAVTFTAPDQYTFSMPPSYGDNTGGVSIAVEKVPEPASLALGGAVLLGLGLARRKHRA